MPKSKATPAAEQFIAHGLTDESAYTPAMQLAIKQKWTGLPIDSPVATLRDAIAKIKPKPVPSVTDVMADLAAQGVSPVSGEAAAAEVKRLKRNAAVQAWRERNQLQAALDARELKFAALRAKRKVVGSPKSETGDAAPKAAVA
jgi:hypothetical protein